jgi:hypothetical protein
MERPYIVKFVPHRKEKDYEQILMRQTKEGKGLSDDGRYQFVIDERIEDADFWVVQGKGLRHSETCNVAPQNILLLTTEPQSVLIYPKPYLRQFGMISSCQEQIKHPNIVFGQAALSWLIGFSKNQDGSYRYSQDYESLTNSPVPPKTKLISVITSDKAFTQGHIDRIKFVEKLKQRYGDKIDVFGRGYRNFDDKWDILAPYKYHVAIENSSQRFYWTEKIADCFLTQTFPFYYGCTNLSDYFPKDAYQEIDILNFEHSIEQIDRIIRDDTYEKKQDVLTECKRLVLGKYNLFNYIASLCDRLDASREKKPVTLQPCNSMQDWRNVYNYVVAYNFAKFKNLFNNHSLLKSQERWKKLK